MRIQAPSGVYGAAFTTRRRWYRSRSSRKFGAELKIPAPPPHRPRGSPPTLWDLRAWRAGAAGGPITGLAALPGPDPPPQPAGTGVAAGPDQHRAGFAAGSPGVHGAAGHFGGHVQPAQRGGELAGAGWWPGPAVPAPPG